MQTVLLLGSTGRTGHHVLDQLLSRGFKVRVIVRSTQKLPAGAAENPNLTVVEAELLSLSAEELQRHVQGCDAVISCLGHILSFKGLFWPPHDLIKKVTARLCQSIEALQPVNPIKVILMTSVSVNHPGSLDPRRGMFERTLLWIIRGLLPPARDNQLAANFLHDRFGTNHPVAQWIILRPDTLLEGDVSEYTLHQGQVNSLFSPGSTYMANVAHFMCELVTNPDAWNAWKGKLPVIVNATATA